MRWITDRRGRERGAVATTVALSMVVMMGFAALAIDLGSAYSDRQQLQNGADAGALAIAQSCLAGDCAVTAGKTATLLKADKYVKANKLDGQATGAAVVDWTAGTVTVNATSIHTNWFAGIIGFPTTPLSALASAQWGNPSGGGTLPIAFSLDCFKNATGGWDGNGVPTNGSAVNLLIGPDKKCTFPAHNEVSGGFGWLSGTNCVSTVLAGGWVLSDPGNDGWPNSCNGFDWTTIQGKTVVVPIFLETRGSGSNAEYKITGLAAFTITGYCFGPQEQYGNLDKCPSTKQIRGQFTLYQVLKGDYSIDPAAPHYGLGTARLSA